jgi:plasmid stability protein
MPQLLIRNLSAQTVMHLKAKAKSHHRSLQGEVKFIVESAAKMSMEDALRISQKWRKKLVGKIFSDSAELIREDRDR